MEKINYQVPFVGNTAADTHCYQASLSMVIQYFYPNKKLTLAELDKATGHTPGHGTWPLQGLEYLREMGIDVLLITPFNYEEFVRDGVEYIRKEYGDEVAEWQDANNDLEADAAKIEALLPTAKIECRNPTYDDILEYLKSYPVMCSIDSAVTRGEEAYTGHFVVIRGCDDDGLYLNDPGLPPRKNVHVPRELFEKAWASFSGEHSKFLYPIISAPSP
jgi:hypothetical protein